MFFIISDRMKKNSTRRFDAFFTYNRYNASTIKCLPKQLTPDVVFDNKYVKWRGEKLKSECNAYFWP